jgi:hypothetical protein
MPSILKAKRIANPGKRKFKRRMTANQIRFFGTKRQKAALKNRGRNRTKNRRRKNIGAILSIGMNPGRKRKSYRRKRTYNKGRRSRNIQVGFWGGDGRFHPIRRSIDYDEDRAGDEYGSNSDNIGPKYVKRGGRKVSKRGRRKNPGMARTRNRRKKNYSRRRNRVMNRRRRMNPRRRTYNRRRRHNPSTIIRYRNRRHHRRMHNRRRRNPDFTSGTTGMVVGVIGGATVTQFVSNAVNSYFSSMTAGSPYMGLAITGIVAAAQGHLAGKLMKNDSFGKNMMVGGFVYFTLQAINTFVPQLSGALGLSGYRRGVGLMTPSSFYQPQVNLPGSMGSFVLPASIPTMAASSGTSGFRGMRGIYPNNAGSRMNFRRVGRMA